MGKVDLHKLFEEQQESRCEKCNSYLDKDLLMLDRLSHNRFIFQYTLEQLKKKEPYHKLKYPECIDVGLSFKISYTKCMRDLRECIRRLNKDIIRLEKLYRVRYEIPKELFEENFKLNEEIKILKALNRSNVRDK